MKRRYTAALWLVFTLCTHPDAARSQSLFAQSIQKTLAASMPQVELLLLDLRTHETLADTFVNSNAPIPTGSLLKPFLAFAYIKAHPGGATPSLICRGHASHCWLPAGHGALGVSEALAQSCNGYFLALAASIDPASIPYLPPPPEVAMPETLIGLTPDWRIAPATLVQAYAHLLAASDLPPAILIGMRASATRGTAARIGPHRGGVLAKIGTAPCIDAHCKASGDGLVLVAVPAIAPRLLLLVRQRATTGATASAAAGHILTQLQGSHAY